MRPLSESGGPLVGKDRESDVASQYLQGGTDHMLEI
jgi:hypothetical protein